MLRIGLTGGFACGKSEAARYFAELGTTVIDSDVIAREIVEKNTPAFTKITEHFGKKILNKNNELDRQQLREIIFANSSEREWLENLLHPIILKKMNAQAEKINAPYCIFVIPLLLEKNLKQYVDRILVIDAPEILQRERAQQRDKLTTEQLTDILRTQLSRSERLSQADDVINNDGNLEQLKQQVMRCHQRYTAGKLV